MGYKTPTSRRTKPAKEKGINLIPILDAVFILIFFLLMSTQFLKIFEISSDVPIVSTKQPPKNKKKPLALTVVVNKNSILVQTGIPSVTRKQIGKINETEYDLKLLHETLLKLKRIHLKENDVILEPRTDLTYEDIIKIMDSIRRIDNTDEPIYGKEKDGTDIQLKKLFSNIIFGNIMS